MRARVLIIEDEIEIGELIGIYLEKEGLEFKLCENAEQGLEALKDESFDLVVLDINLPGMDGFEFLQTVRRKSNIPIVIVSSREEDEDKVLGLGIGADDFVSKPFSPKVLVARIRAHLRRYFDSSTPSKGIICFGPFTLDVEGYTLKKKGERLALPQKELEVLTYLARNAGSAMKAEQIYDHVWGHRYGDLATVAVHIQRLRKRIEDDPAQPCYILTEYGFGYKFNPEAISQGVVEP